MVPLLAFLTIGLFLGLAHTAPQAPMLFLCVRSGLDLRGMANPLDRLEEIVALAPQ